MERSVLIGVVCLLFMSCGSGEDAPGFRVREGTSLGIDFQNTIATNDSLNALSFEYIYNGSGIGVGDFNNDGWEDVFFGGNQVSSELYLNKGRLQFEKVTEKSGVSTNRWITGVSVIDINQDGWLDLYLSVGGMATPENRRNLLYINEGVKDGVPVFREAAGKYGIDDDSYSTMAAFFDYDKDGDPDMYLLNNWLERFNRNNIRPKRVNGEAESTDRLYRNNGDGTFTNVSREAGILIEGYGLGVNICDINNDSWPDIYVANDFLSNDLFWINQGDGTFQNRIGEFLKHQSHNGMGVDVADFNNDERADIVVVDMLPPGHYRQKMMTAGQNYDHFHMALDNGYEPQYMRNTLQLNRGITADGRVLFSEIAFQAGVAQTDWSWAPLFVDFDNDGWKDLFIANGYRKDVTNVDFVFYGLMKENPFGTPQSRKKTTAAELEKLEEVKISNYMFRNNGGLEFEDKTTDWGMEYATFSNGTVYSDLDHDGDLDLVTNNIDQEVIVYENRNDAAANGSLSIRCTDTASFNQKVWVYADGIVQYQELSPYRGFQSTVTQSLHFGMGKAARADSVVVLWPDGAMAIYRNVQSNDALEFQRSDAVKALKPKLTEPSFTFSTATAPDFTHQEKSPSDIKVTRTLLHELSRNGPCVAVGDINGDGLDDVFFGTESGIPSMTLVQQKDGSFVRQILDDRPSREDGAALFFDADQDGDKDLYVASSGVNATEVPDSHRLYLNDGTGRFSKSEKLAPITTPGGCVVASDYDNDGDSDLFIGGRLTPGKYPLPPRSYVLRNDEGTFTDVTTSLSTDLAKPGMVTSALWVDLDQDDHTDLVIAGEWMPIRVFLNRGTQFQEATRKFGLEDSKGWWNCLKAIDLDEDGYPEIIAGNVGRNSFFNPSPEHPVIMMAKDFDTNGSIDPIITYYNPVEKDRFIVHNRLVLIEQIPGMKKRFDNFTKYAEAPADKAFSSAELNGIFETSVTEAASVLLINHGGRHFSIQDLPPLAQLSTLNDVIADDLNGDGYIDLLGVGNSYDRETLFGNYDASIGVILLGTGGFGWEYSNPLDHNFVAERSARSISKLKTMDGSIYLVTNNDGPGYTLRLNAPPGRENVVVASSSPGSE